MPNSITSPRMLGLESDTLSDRSPGCAILPPGAARPVRFRGCLRDASTTRDRLLDAAAHEFAEQGVWNASLIEVTRRAGQRNRAALRYHFGHARRRPVRGARASRGVPRPPGGRAAAKAMATPDDDVGAVVEAIVRPAAELAASGWRGRACLLIVAELAGEDPARFSPELESVLARTGGNEVYALFGGAHARGGPGAGRRALQPHHVVHPAGGRRPCACANAPGTRPGTSSTTRCSWNLVAMVAGAVSAWWPTSLDISRGG